MRRFKVEFFDAIAAQNHDPGLLRMGRVDKHFVVGHWQISWGPACLFAPRAQFWPSSSPRVLASLYVAKSAVFAEDLIVLNVFPTNVVALQRIESSVCLAPIISFWGTTLGARAGAVTRTQPELFTVSTP